MNRLTKEDIENYSKLIIATQLGRVCSKTITKQILSELLEYKHIEEELGIDLVTLFKALKNGANFSKQNETVMGIPFAHIEYSPRLVYGCFKQKWRLQASGYERNVEDYGKTWALTREELL